VPEIKLLSKSGLNSKFKECGISKSVLKRILPEWWDDSVLSTTAGFLEFSQILKNRLGLVTTISDDGDISFSQPTFNLQYKKRLNTDVSSLSDATLVCRAASRTIQRVLNLNNVTQNLTELASSLSSENDLSFERALQLIWSHGIPVLYISKFPSGVTKPTGLVSCEENRFAIILSHKNKSPAMQLFVLLHEVGHIMRNHLTGDGLITDVTMSELGDSLRPEQDQQEIEADDYAIGLLRRGFDIVKDLEVLGTIRVCSDLVLRADYCYRNFGVNPGHYILSYARINNDWPMAINALKFIEQDNALDTLKATFRLQTSSLVMSNDDRDFLSDIQELN
jgi:hypothetical protein